MGKHSSQKISYLEARRRRSALRKRAKGAKALKRRSLNWTWYVAFFAVAILAGGAIGYYAKPIGKLSAEIYLAFKQGQWQPKGVQKGKVAKSLTALSTDPTQSINTLVIGYDKGSNPGETGYCRSDVMMLVCLQEKAKKAVVLSIPRDTKVELPGHGTQKINAAHAFGGPAGAIDAVKALTGLDVNHYIEMNFNGFEKIVNAVGGVPIHLNTAINDPHAGYLPAGNLMLDGWQALVLVRSRNLPNGDIDRIQSQHAFLKALMDKAETMKSVWKAKQLVDIVSANCEMDYNAGQLTNLAEELRGFKISNVQFVTLSGTTPYIGGVSYFVPDMPLLAEVATEIKQDNWISPDLLAKLQSPTPRVEELNAPNADVITVLAGSKGVASAVPTVAQELTLMGHEKIYQGQSKEIYGKTVIIYRKEAGDNLKSIMKAIPEFASAQVIQDQQIPRKYNSPIVVVLGSNFTTPNILAIYGRAMIPAVDISNFGNHARSFN